MIKETFKAMSPDNGALGIILNTIWVIFIANGMIIVTDIFVKPYFDFKTLTGTLVEINVFMVFVLIAFGPLIYNATRKDKNGN